MGWVAAHACVCMPRPAGWQGLHANVASRCGLRATAGGDHCGAAVPFHGNGRRHSCSWES